MEADGRSSRLKCESTQTISTHFLDIQTDDIPIIDLSLLHLNSHTRSLVVHQINEACRCKGLFHIINHGIPESVIEGALYTNTEFFELPIEEKEVMCDDIFKPVRSGTVRNASQDGTEFTREFLKLYAHPFDLWVESWPQKPQNYREKMGNYTKEVRRLGLELLGLIMDSLHLESTYMRDNLEHGIHMMGINCYPPCSQANAVMGIAPHSDHSIMTILLQSCPGLHFLDPTDSRWKGVDDIKGSLQVLVGDHLEVLTNGRCKSVIHRAIPSSERTRLSIASLHSLAMDEVVEPAMELVDKEHPKGYKGSTLRDFLSHLSSGNKVPFIQTLKIC